MTIANTPALDLRRFDSTEPMLYTEVNANTEKLEAGIVSDAYTTATRPTTGLFIGKQIYNSDTGKIEFWNGSGWVTWGNSTSYADLGGATAARPASGTFVGQRYYDQDKKQWFDWDGGVWQPGRGIDQTFTPTWTNLPTPSAQEAHYVINGIWCDFEVIANLSAAATGQIGFTLPVASASYPQGWVPLGPAAFKDNAGIYVAGMIAKMNDAAGALGVCAFYFPASGTNTNTQPATASAPFTANAGDLLSFRGRYRVA